MFKAFIAETYGRFFELPVPIVLVVGWIIGVMLLGMGVLPIYFVISEAIELL